MAGVTHGRGRHRTFTDEAAVWSRLAIERIGRARADGPWESAFRRCGPQSLTGWPLRCLRSRPPWRGSAA